MLFLDVAWHCKCVHHIILYVSYTDFTVLIQLSQCYLLFSVRPKTWRNEEVQHMTLA